MERTINNILEAIVWLGYIASMVLLAYGVGFEEKGSVIGFIIIAPMMFIPFGAVIHLIRANERPNQQRRK